MPRTRIGANAPLYDKTGDQVLTYKPRNELSKMISTGEAIKACKRCGGTGGLKRCHGKVQEHDMIYAATDLFRDTHFSSCYITEADMMANVGIAGKPMEGPNKGRIAAAQAKIKNWNAPDVLAAQIPVGQRTDERPRGYNRSLSDWTGA